MGKNRMAFVTGLTFFSMLLIAQDVVFTASAPSPVQVGEQFQYVIEGSERAEVRMPAIDNFELLAGPYSSYSSHSNWINGKMTQKTLVSYTYVFRAVQEGTFTIPALALKVGRKEYLTNEVEITVTTGRTGAAQGSAGQAGRESTEDGAEVNSSSDEPVFLRVIPSKKEVYIGEQFVSGLKIFTRINTRPGSAASDLPYEGFYKQSLEPDANAAQQEINGQVYVSQVIHRHILIPQKSGDLEIAPYTSDWMIQQRVERQRSNNPIDAFFDDPFFNSYQDVPVTLATLPVKIHVKPLPAGAPVGFTGAVGEFDMKAELSASEISVNEALSLKITVSGAGNIPLMGEPEVNLPPDHDLYDVTRSLQISTAGNRISGSVTFEYPIIARHAGRFRIAPVQFAWFDPLTGSYKTTLTEEFSFNVLKGEIDDNTGEVYAPGVVRENVRNLGTDIRDISRLSPVFSKVNSSLFGTVWYRWFYPLSLLLTVLLIILIRLIARRNADLSLVRNRKAGSLARAGLKKADRFRKADDPDRFYEEIGKAIWGYLSHKMNIETSGLSREVVLEQITKRKVPQAQQNELLRILEESEFSRFAPTSERSDMSSLYKDAAQLIKNLENSLK
ncbi:MAG: BatD family protein [Bacteroidales bacterium]|nr:BatD family protein [Bacteroidales bacterium]